MTENHDHQARAGDVGVVVGLDDSAASASAMAWAAEYARATAQPLLAVHVLDLGFGLIGADLAHSSAAGPGWMAPGQMAMASAAVDAPESARDAEARDRDSNPEPPAGIREMFAAVHPEEDWTLELVYRGMAADVLLDRAAEAALLVIGTGEHTGLRRLISGSVSHYCLSHAKVPVTAVPVPSRR